MPTFLCCRWRSSVERRTSNIERRTSNDEHPTTNMKQDIKMNRHRHHSLLHQSIDHSMFDVQRSTFNVQRSMFVDNRIVKPQL